MLAVMNGLAPFTHPSGVKTFPGCGLALFPHPSGVKTLPGCGLALFPPHRFRSDDLVVLLLLCSHAVNPALLVSTLNFDGSFRRLNCPEGEQGEDEKGLVSF